MPSKVLIIDDDATFRLISSRILSKAGFEVRQADDGPAGLAIAEAECPGVILLDWMMPTMDGPEVCGRIRDDARLSNSQIIMLSARGELDDRVQGLDAGADDYLVKPCEQKELLAHVRSAMRIHELKLQLDQKATLLQESVGKLEELARQREEFTAVLVHDIRSPMSTILAALELTEMRADGARILDDELRTIFQHGYDTVNHIITLVNEILDFSKAESGSVPLEFAPHPMEPFIREAVSHLAVAAQQKGVALRLEIPADLPTIPIDRGKLLRAVGNLLSNAVKFTPAGGTVTVCGATSAGRGLDAGKEFVNIRVEDTGAGIPAKDLPYIFNPYYQAKQKTRQLGTGLGLAIVQRIVAAHSGTVSVQSTEGVGTAFAISLPVL
jgi:two-component system, sensor histidine kinase and response regulator